VKPLDREYSLRASNAEILGSDITFESDFKNIGMWHGAGDHVEWRIESAQEEAFDVYLDYACDAAAAGNELIVEAGTTTLRWKVESTRTWAEYRRLRIGSLKLPAGETRLVVRPVTQPRGALLDLRTVYLTPLGVKPKER
jgi:hypothetical protein